MMIEFLKFSENDAKISLLELVKTINTKKGRVEREGKGGEGKSASEFHISHLLNIHDSKMSC